MNESAKQAKTPRKTSATGNNALPATSIPQLAAFHTGHLATSSNRPNVTLQNIQNKTNFKFQPNTLSDADKSLLQSFVHQMRKKSHEKSYESFSQTTTNTKHVEDAALQESSVRYKKNIHNFDNT